MTGDLMGEAINVLVGLVVLLVVGCILGLLVLAAHLGMVESQKGKRRDDNWDVLPEFEWGKKRRKK